LDESAFLAQAKPLVELVDLDQAVQADAANPDLDAVEPESEATLPVAIGLVARSPREDAVTLDLVGQEAEVTLDQDEVGRRADLDQDKLEGRRER
jgi:hypothetical protein